VEYLHSYRTGRSCKTLVNTAVGYLAHDVSHYDLYSLDIVDYFGSIQKAHWIDAYTFIYTRAAIYLNRVWEDAWDFASYIPGSEQGIVQGNPLSPFISNIVGINTFDKAFMESNDRYCSEHPDMGCGYLRYSDNIYIVVPRCPMYNRSEFALNLNSILDNIHNTYGYRFKLKITSDKQENIILGIRLGKKAQLQHKKWLRSVFHRYAVKKELLAKDQDFREEYGRLDPGKLKEVIDGLAAYAQDVDPGMIHYIHNKLGD
jgi:hypothetical protein